MKLLSALILVFLLSSYCYAEKVCVRDICLDAEVADNDASRILGLMHRDSLEKGKAMLFVFESETYQNFWMKNMRFCLDIIWIDKNKTIVDITKNAQVCSGPCETIAPRAAAKYVLEVNAGWADENKIKAGDKLKF